VNEPVSRPGFARLVAAGSAAIAAMALTATSARADMKTHRVAFHVDGNDPAVMNLALNNIVNAATLFSQRGEMFQCELVAYGPGLAMLRTDTSPVKERLASIKDSIPDVVFSACTVTLKAMEKNEGHPIAIVPQAQLVPAGIARLVELQEAGWAYIKP
jgi:intracellular sulfur oxidation DsrE/DsrF family protein